MLGVCPCLGDFEPLVSLADSYGSVHNNLSSNVLCQGTVLVAWDEMVTLSLPLVNPLSAEWLLESLLLPEFICYLHVS